MNKQRLVLCPAQAVYSFEDSASQYRRVQLDGGAGRYRRDIIRSSRMVTAQWVLKANEYNYLMAFYSRFQTRPDPFILSLVIDESDFSDCDVWFVPGTFRLDSRQGDVYTVSANLEVLPPMRNAVLDDWIVTLTSYFGFAWDGKIDRLHQITNVSLPASFPYPPVDFPEIQQ